MPARLARALPRRARGRDSSERDSRGRPPSHNAILCELNSPQRGPVGERLRRELVAERTHNMRCVIGAESKASAQAHSEYLERAP